MTGAMWFIMWAPTIMSILIAVTTAQKECRSDADCFTNQFCYASSMTCVNYTICSRYNRKESSKPSREASQCGDCLKGYSPELLTESNEAEICKEDLNAHNEKKQGNTTTMNWVIFGGAFAAIILAIIIVYAIYAIIRCKFPCQQGAADDREPEKPSLLMVENGCFASAPPPPSPIQNRNNNKYHDAEETNPLSTTREYRTTKFIVDSCRPVKAQGFHPPEYVRTDPSYNPEDTQLAQPMFSPPDVDEETIPSAWTPGPISSGTLPAQSFAAIAEEVQENTTNTAIQRLACPSPSTSQESQDNGQNNNSSGNSAGYSYNTGNTGNQNSPSLVQVHQIVNIFQHGNNAR